MADELPTHPSGDQREPSGICEGAQVVRDDARLLRHETGGRKHRRHRASGKLARTLHTS